MLQDPPRPEFCDSVGLPHKGPGRKRKGRGVSTLLPKGPPPLPSVVVPTSNFRTDTRERLTSTSPPTPAPQLELQVKQQPIHSAPARTCQEFLDKPAD